ncbi:MAG: hypothetical protein WDW36_004000 [Sanguina aurantia]
MLGSVNEQEELRTLLLILTWYILGTTLNLFNKQMVGADHGFLGKGPFPAPLLMCAIQFMFQHCIARAAFRLRLFDRTAATRATWAEFGHMVVNTLPNGVTTGIDIGFSNKSLASISISFYVMCKSTVPIFLLIFAFIWRIEKPSWELAGVVGVITAGLALLVKGETDFDLLGFVLVMAASCASGLRFVLTQVLLHGHRDKAALGGPLEMVELLTPFMAGTVLALSAAWEPLGTLGASPYFSTPGHTLQTLGIILAGAVIAFFMVWAEYSVIKETSALTFMIAGTCKEVFTVLAAVVIMGDRLGLLNSLGLLIVILGVLGYNWHKYQRTRSGHALDTHHTQLSRKEGALGKRDDDTTTAGYSALEMEPLGPDTPAFRRVSSSSPREPKPLGSSAAAPGPSAGGGGDGESDRHSDAGVFSGVAGLSSGGGGVSAGAQGVNPSFQVPRSSPAGAAPSSPDALRVRASVAGSAGDGGGLGLMPRPVISPSHTSSGGGAGVLEPRRPPSTSGVAVPLLGSGGSGRHAHLTLAYTPDLAEGVGEGGGLHPHHDHHHHHRQLLMLASPTLTHRPTEGQPHG